MGVRIRGVDVWGNCQRSNWLCITLGNESVQGGIHTSVHNQGRWADMLVPMHTSMYSRHASSHGCWAGRMIPERQPTCSTPEHRRKSHTFQRPRVFLTRCPTRSTPEHPSHSRLSTSSSLLSKVCELVQTDRPPFHLQTSQIPFYKSIGDNTKPTRRVQNPTHPHTHQPMHLSIRQCSAGDVRQARLLPLLLPLLPRLLLDSTCASVFVRRFGI